MEKHRTPSGLNGPGKKLWASIADDFELSDHELALLEEACFMRDSIASLRKIVKDDGMMIGSSQGSRRHPAIAESRQQQLALARLLATLQVPGLDEDDLPSSSGVRGLYANRSGR